jgi:hypothetical protein
VELKAIHVLLLAHSCQSFDQSKTYCIFLGVSEMEDEFELIKVDFLLSEEIRLDKAQEKMSE